MTYVLVRDEVKRPVLQALEQFYGQGYLSCSQVAQVSGLKRHQVANYMKRQKSVAKHPFVKVLSHRPLGSGYGDTYGLSQRGLDWLDDDYQARGVQTCC